MYKTSCKQTPWGVADQEEQIAEGIVSYATPSHGGIGLSSERWKQLKRVHPNFRTFCGMAGWLEEDCDWAFAAITWPMEFPPRAVFHAVLSMAADYNHRKLAPDFWQSAEGRQAEAIALEYATTHEPEAREAVLSVGANLGTEVTL